MANFTGLKVGRDQRLGVGVREAGVRGAGEVALYASEDSHAVIDRAADMLGLGTRRCARSRWTPSGACAPTRSPQAIDADLARGVHPIAVVATAGTTATGAIDPLPEIADLCERHDLWLHVDAAYGGPAVLAPDLAPLLAGIERADSIALDPHKWLYVPFACGCVLIRARPPSRRGRSRSTPATSGRTRRSTSAAGSTRPAAARSSAAASRR